MRKILLSILTVSAVAIVAVVATGAYFSDTETSTGNTFVAGELDLKVDNECHYWTDADANRIYTDVGCADGAGGIETEWILSDLVPGVHKFFNFSDIKPGDFGEDTVSLHVFDNDAWGRLLISNVSDLDNSCEEPEKVAEGGPCGSDGELRENLSFWVWLDQGAIPGFQCLDETLACVADPTEGDNVWQDEDTTHPFDGPDDEPPLIFPGTIDLAVETHNIWEGLALAALTYGEVDGLHLDGHMEGSTTYYFGIGWELPESVGNEVQSDSLGADMTFEVEQYRNNPTPFGS